jgi:arylsulfatase A-like enzyme
LPPHRPPNYNEADIADKPLWVQQRPLISPAKAEHIDQFRRAQLQTLRSADRAIGAILDWLEEQGILDETVVFFLSDNGYFWGEHRLTLKNLPYQEGARVPFAMRYPPLIPQGHIETRLVANIDIAPTIYKLAGITPPPDIDGRSIVRLLEAPQEWRTDLLIEGWPNGRTFRAVHTGDHVYIETDGDRNELYDMRLDPYQLENKAEDPAYRQILARMQNRLARLRGQ